MNHKRATSIFLHNYAVILLLLSHTFHRWNLHFQTQILKTGVGGHNIRYTIYNVHF